VARTGCVEGWAQQLDGDAQKCVPDRATAPTPCDAALLPAVHTPNCNVAAAWSPGLCTTQPPLPSYSSSTPCHAQHPFFPTHPNTHTHARHVTRTQANKRTCTHTYVRAHAHPRCCTTGCRTRPTTTRSLPGTWAGRRPSPPRCWSWSA